MRKSEQKKLINTSENSDFQRISGFGTLPNENFSNFVTGIDIKEDFLKKFPVRPQSSHVILQKKCKGLIKKSKNKRIFFLIFKVFSEKKEKKDLSGGFFDCEKGQFIRKKIIETPAILVDVKYRISFVFLAFFEQDYKKSVL